ncbi:ArsC/Spx/MgsR family protein [Aphanothece sacrum]|uniref:Nitrogenase-associated protein n=1 Tax=Aphanothece sacrum FPU1 TaxID=1920663 RepID=A0A401ICN6_APHSA|nr:ArsC/Spx/MgsR family protein [Aphanothece sacrum]GBF79012.1 nitrogenase-associated protein [Aphanothece sacrum FPU1]GBF86109.1 nitrogenase-associated protein [Aphanothece sacrum FPU3]
MAKVIFYEKPGCINNTKQRNLLQAAGHNLEAHSLLTTAWTPETLRPFFGNLPVTAWFNSTSPRIKSEEVVPEQLDEAQALELMIADPLLIRRPLIQVGETCQVGFDIPQIEAWIGLNPQSPVTEDLETCPRHG